MLERQWVSINRQNAKWRFRVCRPWVQPEQVCYNMGFVACLLFHSISFEVIIYTIMKDSKT